MRTAQVTVTTSPTLLFDISTVWRECHIHNESGTIYIGGSNVTTSTGAKVDNNSHDVFNLPPTTKLYAVVSGGTAIVYCLEVHS
jgi:hypothetical protein